MSSVFLLPQNVLPLLHPTVLEDRGKTLRAVIFGVEEALTLEAIIFFKVSLLPGSPATPAHPGTGRERPTYLTSSRPKACAERGRQKGAEQYPASLSFSFHIFLGVRQRFKKPWRECRWILCSTVAPELCSQRSSCRDSSFHSRVAVLPCSSVSRGCVYRHPGLVSVSLCLSKAQIEVISVMQSGEAWKHFQANLVLHVTWQQSVFLGCGD